MSEIHQVPAVLTVIEDGNEFIIQASKATGKRLGALILAQLPNATRVTYADEMGVKVFKSNGKSPVQTPAAVVETEKEVVPSIPVPPSRRIIQDPSAPPSPELAEEDYEATLKLQEEEARELARQEQFNSQQAIPPIEEEPPAEPRKRTRNINTVPSTCGRCAGTGTVLGEAGFQGVCPVCAGKKTIQTWGRARRV